MNRTLRRYARPGGAIAASLLALALAAAPALAAPAPAGARSTTAFVDVETQRTRCAEVWRAATADPTVESWQKVGFCEIDRRLATIERLRGAIDDARALTDDHAAALTRILDASAEGLRALRAEIEAGTTLAELREDIRRIFSDFRIYVLVVRQVFLVIGADAVDGAANALDETAGDLAVLIERAEAQGQDVTEANAHLAAMEAAIAEAEAGVAGVAERVLPLTPADWNDGSAGPVLRAARQAIADARLDLRTAMAEARAVIAALAG